MHNTDFNSEPEYPQWIYTSSDAAMPRREDATHSSCDESAGALAAFFDGESTPEETHRAALHLQNCASCRARLQSWRQTRDLLLSMHLRPAPPMLLPRILAALRLMALRESLGRSVLRDASRGATAYKPDARFDVAPPTQLAHEILQTTSRTSHSRVLASSPSRAASSRRGASRVLAMALPACLIAAALSTQYTAQNRTVWHALSPDFAPQRATVMRAQTLKTKAPETKSSVASRPQAFKSQENAAPSNATSVASTRDAASRVTIAPSPVPAANATSLQVRAVAQNEMTQEAAQRDLVQRARDLNEVAPNSDETARFSAVKLSNAPRSDALHKAAPMLATFIAKNPPQREFVMSAPQTRIAERTSSSAFRRRAAAPPRLTAGASGNFVHDRIARNAALSMTSSRHGEWKTAPRATRPEAPLAMPVSYDANSFSQASRAASSAPLRVASASSVFEEDGRDFPTASNDALDELRATTNSYRAALDAETESADDNVQS